MERVAESVVERMDRLSLEDQVALLTGHDFWHTVAMPAIGLRSLRLSDGPVGVRGPVWDERRPSLNLPSASLLAATWDEDQAVRYAAVLAGEARRRGVDVLLAPTINLHRSPLGGRHFEAFSEDPMLTGRLAAAMVAGLQAAGVGACAKHYVANEFETERFTASVEVSDRALHEVYLAPFEAAVRAGVWTVMSAYNSINGVTASENDLLEDPLKSTWGFSGLVISDWGGARSLAAASAGQDLVMPGPRGPWGAALVEAVRAGKVPAERVAEKVRRLLLLAARVGALDGVPAASQDAEVPDAVAGQAVARSVAADGMVLVRNQGLLPLAPSANSRVAMIGHNAIAARTQGGGSATVLPEAVVNPLDGLRAALPGVQIDHAMGAVVQEGVAGLPLTEVRDPVTNQPGVRVHFRDAAGEILFSEHRLSTDLVWFGGDAPVAESRAVDIDFEWTPCLSGTVALGYAAIGAGTVTADGTTVVSGTDRADGPQLGANPLRPNSRTGLLEVAAGVTVSVRTQVRLAESSGLGGLLAIRVGVDPVTSDPNGPIDEAVTLAAESDIAIVVVGTNADVESEGSDRTSLALPGEQDRLVRAVAATGTPTVVVVNSGAPVLLPWRNEVDAVVIAYFGGQEMGAALADVLLGACEPGGRLPTTWPGEDEPPVLDVTPVDGRVEYVEGIHIGYRAWLRAGTQPAYPFGHGLGYTTWELDGLEVTPPRSTADGRVTVNVCNTGARAGKQVVQVYLARSDEHDRPARWLATYGVVRADAGTATRLEMPLPWRAFARWADGWHHDPGDYQLLVGTSVTDLPLRTTVELA